MTDAPPPHTFWQRVDPPGTHDLAGPFRHAYPAVLPDSGELLLPIRVLPDRRHALASLIVNQASFAVEEALAHHLASRLVPLAPDIIVGVPTLGLALARATARALGHARMVPMGTSRKFWYDEALSVPLSSITSPKGEKRLYLDPRMLPLIENRRVALVDDVVSSGASIAAALDLLAKVGVAPVAIGTAMLQSERWRDALDGRGRVEGVFRTPLLAPAGPDLWSPQTTQPSGS